jgi:hypothetical protein
MAIDLSLRRDLLFAARNVRVIHDVGMPRFLMAARSQVLIEDDSTDRVSCGLVPINNDHREPGRSRVHALYSSTFDCQRNGHATHCDKAHDEHKERDTTHLQGGDTTLPITVRRGLGHSCPP